MTTEEQIAKDQDERNQARQHLRETLTEVNAKVERVVNDLRPPHLVGSHPVAASLIAGALGFLIGSSVDGRRTGAIMIAAALGVALSIRSSRAASEPDGTDTAASD